MSPPQNNLENNSNVEIDEQTIYRAVRFAVEDAILAVLGTLLLLGIAFVIIMAGAQMLTVGSVGGFVAGGLLIVFALYLAGTTLGVFPSVRQFL